MDFAGSVKASMIHSAKYSSIGIKRPDAKGGGQRWLS
jgi:hypothetical protein